MIALPQQEEVAIWRTGQTNTEREICLCFYSPHKNNNKSSSSSKCSLRWVLQLGRANSTHSGHLSLQIFNMGISLVVVVGWAAMTNENSNHLSISFSRIVFPSAVMPWMSLCSGRRGIPGAINFPSLDCSNSMAMTKKAAIDSDEPLSLYSSPPTNNTTNHCPRVYFTDLWWKKWKNWANERKWISLAWRCVACVPVWREKGWMEFWLKKNSIGAQHSPSGSFSFRILFFFTFFLLLSAHAHAHWALHTHADFICEGETPLRRIPRLFFTGWN